MATRMNKVRFSLGLLPTERCIWLKEKTGEQSEVVAADWSAQNCAFTTSTGAPLQLRWHGLCSKTHVPPIAKLSYLPRPCPPLHMYIT